MADFQRKDAKGQGRKGTADKQGSKTSIESMAITKISIRPFACHPADYSAMNATSTVSFLSRALMRLLLVCFLFTLSGCVHDISHDPRGRNGYIVGAVYRVKRPLTFSRTALSDSAIVLDDHI